MSGSSGTARVGEGRGGRRGARRHWELSMRRRQASGCRARWPPFRNLASARSRCSRASVLKGRTASEIAPNPSASVRPDRLGRRHRWPSAATWGSSRPRKLREDARWHPQNCCPAGQRCPSGRGLLDYPGLVGKLQFEALRHLGAEITEPGCGVCVRVNDNSDRRQLRCRRPELRHRTLPTVPQRAWYLRRRTRRRWNGPLTGRKRGLERARVDHPREGIRWG